MKISGVKIPAGVTITAPAQEQEQPQAPTGPSKFIASSAYGGDNSGAAYVYTLDGTHEVTVSPGIASINFGLAVAMSDTKIVGTSEKIDSNTGAFWIYNTDGTGEQKITASDGATGDKFGNSVAMTDTKIVVSAESDDDAGSSSGSVYVYNTDGTGEVKITASDGAQNDRFGYQVAIQGDKIIVGAPYDDDAGSSSGSVYVYNLDGTGEVKITESDGAAGGHKFGESVA